MNIDIFDEHHEVMLFWNDISHKLNKKVLHVDFHSDMWTPGEPINYQFSKSPGFLTESLYQENIRDFVENNLSPTDFMIPSILRFRFDGVVHLKPVGEDIVHNDYCIGSLFGQGKIIRNVTEENKDFFPDNIKYSFFETTDVKKINWDDYLLDIDLDYFCCNMNPVSCHSLKTKYNKSISKRINSINTSNDKYRINLNLIKISNNENDLIMKPSFRPVYNDDIEWIKYEIENFVYNLKIIPDNISICRSVRTGYFPKKYIDFTEKYLIHCLKFGCSKPIYPMYKNLKITPFTKIINNKLYNYSTEMCLVLDEIGMIIFNLINEQNANTDDIINQIIKLYKGDYQIIKNDIIEYINNLRKMLFVF